MKKIFSILALSLYVFSFNAQAIEAEARITVNGQAGSLTINQNTPAKIELHLEGNEDEGKSADYYVMAFLPKNANCVASEVGLDDEVCGFTYKAKTNTWTNLPLGSSLIGNVFTFNNFTLLEATLPAGTYQISFFVVNNLNLSLIAGDEITLTVTP